MIASPLLALDLPLRVLVWEDADQKVWTLTLRDGLLFHDGTPVLGRDVVASLRRWGARDLSLIHICPASSGCPEASQPNAQYGHRRGFRSSGCIDAGGDVRDWCGGRERSYIVQAIHEYIVQIAFISGRYGDTGGVRGDVPGNGE